MRRGTPTPAPRPVAERGRCGRPGGSVRPDAPGGGGGRAAGPVPDRKAARRGAGTGPGRHENPMAVLWLSAPDSTDSGASPSCGEDGRLGSAFSAHPPTLSGRGGNEKGPGHDGPDPEMVEAAGIETISEAPKAHGNQQTWAGPPGGGPREGHRGAQTPDSGHAHPCFPEGRQGSRSACRRASQSSRGSPSNGVNPKCW